LHGFFFRVCEEGHHPIFTRGERRIEREIWMGEETHAEGSKSMLPLSFLILYNIRIKKFKKGGGL
jgi:hypothetical protein